MTVCLALIYFALGAGVSLDNGRWRYLIFWPVLVWNDILVWVRLWLPKKW